jgi:ATP-binding cassette subfamily F protein uup
MALISISDVHIGFRGPDLLDGVHCQIEHGDRIGLLGRNGAGKTTLMRMLCGDIEPDHGSVICDAGTRVALLAQDVPRDIHGSVRDVVARGLPADWPESEQSWQHEQSLNKILDQMALPGDVEFSTQSSGRKRRVLLAQTLVAKPDLLLLDEPTNHLDIDSIRWLEEFLISRWKGTVLFVTHDRMFLRKLANRILEIDRGKLYDWSCDFDTFLARKEAEIEAQQKQDALFDKKLAIEEVWIRQGIKARRTRNEGRVRALKTMRDERLSRRSDVGRVALKVDEGIRSGNMVIRAKDLTFGYDETPIVTSFETTIMRGDKVGFIGPNGVGKTTLLRLLVGQLTPQCGSVRLGSNLQIAYFDQLREQLDDEKSVEENVGDGYDTIQIGGRSQHIIGYLQNFLFTPERVRTPVKFLSGGERNRILLAKLFSKPANVIVLDEPTNDLDAETLELLEERLVEFAGTVLLVSHDREFLNNVVTSSIVFEDSDVREYVGGYDDWLRQRSVSRQASSRLEKQNKKASQTKTARDSSKQLQRLSFKEKREIEALPSQIEDLEGQITAVHDQMASPNFFKHAGEEIAQTQANLQMLQSTLETAYARWEELEGRLDQEWPPAS